MFNARYHTGDKITSGVSSPSVSAPYQGLIDSNPYRNAEYNVSPWNQFLSWLGFRTQADAWQENMSVQASEYDAQILQKQYDESYNDPTKQVARMRAAGLNPDLSGGQGIDSGSAQNLGQDPSTPMQSAGDEVKIREFADSILSAFSSAIGIVSTFQGVRRTHLQNSLMVSDLAKERSLDFVPVENPEPSDGDYAGRNWTAVALDNAKAFAKYNLPRSYRSKFLRSIQSYWRGIPADIEARKAFLEREQTRKGYAKEISENWSPFDNLLRAIWKPLGKLAEDINKKSLEANLSTEENRGEYQDALDPVSKAESENSQNVNSQQNADIEFYLKNAFSEILKNLKSVANDGGAAGTAAQALLVTLSLRQMELLPSLRDLLPFVKAL